MEDSGQGIQTVVSSKVPKQLKQFQQDLEKSNQHLIDCILSAQKLDDVVSKSSYKEFSKAQANMNANFAKEEKIRAQLAILAQREQQAILKTQEIKDRAAAREAANQEKQRKAEERATKAENERIVAQAKKGKAIISNSQLEIDAYNNSVNGNKKVTSALTATAQAENRVASSAAAVVSSNKKVETSFLKVSPAAVAAQRSISSLKIQLDSYKAVTAGATDPMILETFNAKIQETETKIKQLSNVGKEGFDEFGNAIEDTGGGVGDAYGKLKELANILPGIGVAGIIAFAAGPIIDYIASLDLFGKKLSETLRTRQMLSKVQLKGAQDAQSELTQLKTLYKISQDTAFSTKQRIEATDELQEKYPKYFANLSNEIIMNGQAGKAYDRLASSIIATAKARAAQDQITENSSRILEDEQKMTDLQAERLEYTTKEYNSLKRRAEQQNSLYTDAQKHWRITESQIKKQVFESRKVKEIDEEIFKLAKDREIFNKRNLALEDRLFQQVKNGADLTTGTPKAAKEKFDRSEFDNQREMVEMTKNAAKEIVDNEQESLDLRLMSLDIYLDAASDLTRINYEREVEKAKGNAEHIKFLHKKFMTDRADVQIEGRKMEQKINEAAEEELRRLFKKGLKDYEDSEKKKIEILKVANEERMLQLTEYASSALEGAAYQYAQGIINEKQYLKAKLEINKQYSLDILSEELNGLQRIIDAKHEADLETADDQKSLTILRKKLAKETADQEIAEIERVAEVDKLVKAKRKELQMEVFNLGAAIGNATFENEKNKIREQMDLNEKKYALDIENIKNSVATEQEKADKIAVIQAQAEAQKNLLEQRQRQIQQRQARFDRAVTIAKIIADTASAVVEALPNIPLSVLTGAIGAVQIATVLATPIPAYKVGTSSSKAGLALTDEAGAELYIPPTGKPYIGSDQPNIKNLEAGTKIIPHHELVQLMAKPDPLVSVSGTQVDLTPLIKITEKGNEKLYRAIKEQKQAPPMSKRALYEANNQAIQLMEWRKRNI